MKIQCDVCEAVEAQVMCCADEAALCGSCDIKIHAVNKLAAKHQRLHLFPSSMPICDVCQEALGFILCLEHRAVVCRKCDITMHKASPLASTHQRFLFTGVRVGLKPIVPSSTQIPSRNMVEFLDQSKGMGNGISEWSRILQSVEGMLNGNLVDNDDISWRVPESLTTNVVPDIDPISTGTMEMQINNSACLPKFGFLTTHKLGGGGSSGK